MLKFSLTGQLTRIRPRQPILHLCGIDGDLHKVRTIWNTKSSTENWLLVRLIFKFSLLHHILVGHTNIFFCELLKSNPFMRTFIKFTIVVLIWYDFTIYYKFYLSKFLLGYLRFEHLLRVYSLRHYLNRINRFFA